MIYIQDNFLPKNLYKALLNYVDKFEEIKYPDKSFWTKDLPSEFNNFIVDKLEKIEGRKIKNILSFAREAKLGQDNDWRIHNDTIIKEDSNNKTKWKLSSVIGYKDNRLLSYPCEYFHSKYPNEYKNQRIVIVMFYKYI